MKQMQGIQLYSVSIRTFVFPHFPTYHILYFFPQFIGSTNLCQDDTQAEQAGTWLSAEATSLCTDTWIFPCLCFPPAR